MKNTITDNLTHEKGTEQIKDKISWNTFKLNLQNINLFLVKNTKRYKNNRMSVHIWLMSFICSVNVFVEKREQKKSYKVQEILYGTTMNEV